MEIVIKGRPHRTSRGELSVEATELPKSSQARLLNGLGTCYINAVPELKAQLEGAGYSVLNATASVESLKTVSSDGVFSYARSKLAGTSSP